jgi:hypothetical protein
MTQRTSLTIMADYHQIHICDPAHVEDWSDLWTEQTVADRIVACPHTVVFGNDRYELHIWPAAEAFAPRVLINYTE